MTQRPVLVIALDGYEASLAAAMAADGLLPALTALNGRGACFALDHDGDAKRTGLAGEHFATGLTPDAARRWSAVHFDRRSYDIVQPPTVLPPFAAGLSARTVVFDPAYFDLEQAPSVRGVVSWGAHDPGVPPASRPASLQQEMLERFGPYPAQSWIYGFVWHSLEKTKAMGADLAKAVDVRAEAATWLLKDRLPDWDLAVVMVSECHSAIEGLWHGVDPGHPLHGVASARAAGEGVREVYKAIDRLVGKLVAAFPDASVVLFSMHGMGSNDADIASMVLLPELLYRDAFGKPYLAQGGWDRNADGVPMLAEDGDWHEEMRVLAPDARSRFDRLRARLTGRVGFPIDWMPGARYRPFWPRMPAFALPSYYDGRIRINLAGREARGRTPLAGYRAACDRLEDLVGACRDPLTGQPAAASIQRSGRNDPRDLSPTEADIVITWAGAPLGFDHPALGRIGPTPYRRTGGHTGRHGMAVIAGERVKAGSYGVASAFDIAPTIVDMVGGRLATPISGASLLAAIRA